MKTSFVTSFIALLGLLSGGLSANTVPSLISYQGYLAEGNGVPLGNTSPVNRKMIFSLFDDPDEGSRVWTEQQIVTVSRGEFSVLLGSGTAVGSLRREALANVFSTGGGNLYLEIVVDTGNGEINLANISEDPPLKPRQRIVSTAFAFRALSADGISSGSDLRFLASDDPANSNQGLGFYDTSRQFGSTAVNGPVLYGQGGGALGTAAGATKNVALAWQGNGNVGIGVYPPTERLDISGNVKATGSLSLGGALTTAGDITASGVVNTASVTSTGAITGRALTGTSLVIKPAAAATEVAGINSAGVINITMGGTLNGPVGRPLNITSQGQITIKDLEVTDSIVVPNGGGGTVPQVLTTQKRLVLGGASGWGDSVANTAADPVSGSNAATGMRVILSGTNAGSDLLGFGQHTNAGLFTVIPTTGEMQWFGGLEQIMTLASTGGVLTAKEVKAAGSDAVVKVHGTTSARLLLTQTKTETSETKDLALTMNSDSSAGLSWIGADGATLVPIMNFLVTDVDSQLQDQITSKGYVGINVAKPRAPLHVKQVASFEQNWSNMGFGGTGTERGVFLGADGALKDYNGVGAANGDNWSLKYEYIAAIFDGEIMCTRSWVGQGLDASSDARAKKILGLSDIAKDLDTLMKLQVTNYQWIDERLDKHRPHKRLIAQQVEEVFPQAVSIAPRPQAIPDVYEMASELKHDAAIGTLTVTTKKAHGFKTGDLVDLIGDKKEMKETLVKAVLSAQSFVIDCTEPPKSLFVYGKQINDFHTVDYDAVSMLNVSATQQLQLRRDALAAENAQLREKLASERNRLKALEAEQKTDDAKFAVLEALINRAVEKPSELKPASLISR